MADLDGSFSREFKRETWALYAVGIFGAVLRSIARIRRLGIQNLQIDDFLMVFALVWYTLLCVALNQVVTGGGSNLMDENDIRNLTPSIKAEREKGSKWVFVSEHSFLLTIWALKACMLVIYTRLTDGLRQRKWLIWLSVYVGLGFIGSELALFLICRPLSNYWAVPTPNPQCSNYQYYEIIQGCFSISSDAFMLLIAIPLLLKVHVPLKQKLILLFLFGMGIFVIVCAVLTKVYCLVPSLISYVYMSWYFREATVAILVTNLPLVWSLLRDIFPTLASWTGGSGGRSRRDRYWYGSRSNRSRSRSRFWSSNNNKKGFSGSRAYAYGASTKLPSETFGLQDYTITTVTPQKNFSDGSLEGQHQHHHDHGHDGGSGSGRSSREELSNSSEDGSARALKIRQEITVTVERDLEPIIPPPTTTPTHPSAEYYLHGKQ